MKKLRDIAEEMAALTPGEAKELLVILEEDHGIKPAENPFFAAEEEPPAEEEQVSFDLMLTSVEDRIKTIRLVKELTGLSLGESRDKIDDLPSVLLENASRESAEDAARRFKELNCNTEIK